MGVKKATLYAGTYKVCNTSYAVNEEVFMQKNGESWIICKDEQCFKQQGGVIDPPKQSGGRFTSSKFNISEAPEIYTMAETLTEQYKKKHPDMSPETEAQFLESMFKTLAGSFKK